VLSSRAQRSIDKSKIRRTRSMLGCLAERSAISEGDPSNRVAVLSIVDVGPNKGTNSSLCQNIR